MIAHKVMDLCALHEGVAMVLYDHVGESGSGPRFTHAVGDILIVDAPIQGALSVAPQFPGRRRGTQLLEEPFLLLDPKDRLYRTVFAEIRYLLSTKPNQIRRLPAGVGTPGVQHGNRF